MRRRVVAFRRFVLQPPLFGIRLYGLTPLLFAAALLAFPAQSSAQASAGLNGTVTDETGAAIVGATITVRQTLTNLERRTRTNDAGHYQIAGLDVGSYRIVVQATGFRTQVVEELTLDVGRTSVHDFMVSVGSVAEEVSVTAGATVADRATLTAGHLVDRQTIETTPLNGRHFVDLALLAPGSVTPPQNGFLSRPTRGLGIPAVNTAGHREDATNFLINGINMNDQVNNVLMLQPTLGAIQEFRIDTSTPGAEYGRSSGAVVNIVTRSGTNVLHGSVFELFRDDALDARNYFNSTLERPPFRRHQFGGDVGGPIVRNRTFFLVAYEGVRQEQGLDVNSVVPSDSERASVVDPTIARVIALIPRANGTDTGGTARFVGFASAPVVINQAAIDVMHSFARGAGLHAFYAIQFDRRTEPFQQGNTIPGFGDLRTDRRQILTLSYTQPFGSRSVNEARAGFNRFAFDARPATPLNPAAFGLATGFDRPIGLPQVNVAGAFNFGGPAMFPQANVDPTFVASETFTSLRGDHALKIGGEFRRYTNDFAQLDPGTFNFPSVAAFLAGAGNAFSILTGDRSTHISQGAVGLFVQDAWKWRPNVTVDVGLRYEWNMSPTERDNRFVVFDPSTVSLVRVGVDTDAPVYRQNNLNVEPRVGFAWTRRGGRIVLSGGYAMTVQQPTTNIVFNLAGNPPFGVPLTITGPVRLDTAIQSARSAGLAPLTVQPDYRNATVRSWNMTVRREMWRNLSATVSYVGSRGAHLPIVLNVNQPVDGVRPFQSLSTRSPILPGTPLGNIIETASTGRSTYTALWATLTRRLTHGLRVDGSYTLSASHDFNSLSSPPTRVTVQDSYNLRDSLGPSDFDARHRFVLRATYDLPWRGNAWIEGWRLAGAVQGQSGNPINIVTNSSTVTGTANTVRPDVTGPIRIIGQPDQWFDTSVFAVVNRFGTLPRNAVVGPRFDNLDVSIAKTVRIGPARAELRADAFNLLNHPNFGQPGQVVGSPNFGRITNTRFPVGDVGSSRQIQLGARLDF
jgi:carboxypeptidase family protein